MEYTKFKHINLTYCIVDSEDTPLLAFDTVHEALEGLKELAYPQLYAVKECVDGIVQSDIAYC